MSNGAFATGWRVVRTRRSEFVDAKKARRRTVVSGLVAVVAGAILVVSEILWGFDLEPVRGGLALLVLAGAAGCLAAPLVAISRPVISPPRGKTAVDWRRGMHIERYFSPRPPVVTSEDRDDVLAWADATLGPSVVAADRFVWNPVAFLLAWIGFLAGGASLAVVPMLVVGPVVFGALQCVPFVSSVLTAGRGNAARRRALALPPASIESDAQADGRPVPREGRPPGSQLALPEE
jgi:hypothetical protein